MSEQPDYAHQGSSSSIGSSVQDIEDEVTIGSILADKNQNSGRSLGKRLSHLGSIPVLCVLFLDAFPH